MKDTWGAGPLEMLRHAKTHLDRGNPLDDRLAFLGTDNAVELALRNYCAVSTLQGKLPHLQGQELGDLKFGELLDHATTVVASSATSIAASDIEVMHEIRNRLYHFGFGLSVEPALAGLYFQLASDLLSEFFGVNQRELANPTSNLRPDVKAELEKQVLNEIENQRSEIISASMRRAKAEGTLQGRRRTRGLTEEEETLILKLDTEGYGQKRIANEINRRRALRHKSQKRAGQPLLTDYRRVRWRLLKLRKEKGGEAAEPV